MTVPGKDAASSLITLDGVDKIYKRVAGGAVIALDQVSLRVNDGEFVSIIGESGCGKSTLLKIIGGLIDADSGHINLAGTPARAGRRDVGMMLQTPALLPWRSVIGNVMLPLRLFGDLSPAEIRQRAMDAIELVGLSGSEKLLPSQLSGGMQQRASLARLLSFKPQIQLMDEPFGALDEILRESLNLEIARIHDLGGQTAVFVTHSVQEAVLVSDRILIMASRPGRVARDLKIDLPRPRTAEIVRTPEFAAETARVRGIFEDVRREQKQGSAGSVPSVQEDH